MDSDDESDRMGWFLYECSGGDVYFKPEYKPAADLQPQPELRHLAPFSIIDFINAIHYHKRRTRKEDGDRWTTPGLRPLAEPPHVAWEEILDRALPSEKRTRLLFPRDPEKRCRMLNLEGEERALWEYWGQSLIMREGGLSTGRTKFWAQLLKEIRRDHHEVLRERVRLHSEAGALEQFEYFWLSNDGVSTQRLEENLENGYFFKRLDPEIYEKYKALFDKHGYGLDGRPSRITLH